MSSPHDDHDDPSAPGDQFDLRLLWLLLIPGVLVGAIIVHIIAGHSQLHPSAATSDLTVSAPQQVGRCAVPTAQQLSQLATAVRATVTTVGGGSVELRVTNVLAGPQIGVITVRLPASGEATADTSLPAFVQGHSYLLGVTADNKLAGCGMSGPSDTALEDLYHQAFG